MTTPETQIAQLIATQNWAALNGAAEQLLTANKSSPLGWRAKGIADSMSGGGTLGLLQSAALGDQDAMIWLEVIQELSLVTGQAVQPGFVLKQVQYQRLRRSGYMNWPKEIHLETLALCNAKCTFCPYPNMERQGDRMPDELIEKIIVDLEPMPKNMPFTVSLFKVNDPLLDKRIFSIANEITSRLSNARLRLFTNGSPLTDSIVEKIAGIQRLEHLWISLNECEETAYEALMGLPLRRTLEKLDALHTRVVLGFPHQVVVSRVADHTERDLAFVRFVKERYPRFSPFLIGRGDWAGQVAGGQATPTPPLGCERWFEVSIMASGKVALCCMDGEGKHVIGDVRLNSIYDIYNHPGYRKMRQFQSFRAGAAAPCDSCVY